MSLIGATLDLFMRNLTAFAWTSIAPALALSVLHILLDGLLGDQAMSVRLVLFVPLLFATFVIWSATTLVAAGAVLGHVPDVSTAYRCALRSPLLTLLTSTVLLVVLILVGSILLVVPGLIALALTLLVPAIVILERRPVWESLRRSRALGSGFYVRNVLIVIALSLPALLASMVVGSAETYSAAADVAVAVLNTVLQTLTMIATVLLYIDMRARKENVDPNTFALEINAAYGEQT
jgi:hypothetical protein